MDLELENNGDDFIIETPCYQHEDNYCTQTPSQRSKIICHEGTWLYDLSTEVNFEAPTSTLHLITTLMFQWIV